MSLIYSEVHLCFPLCALLWGSHSLTVTQSLSCRARGPGPNAHSTTYQLCGLVLVGLSVPHALACRVGTQDPPTRAGWKAKSTWGGWVHLAQHLAPQRACIPGHCPAFHPGTVHTICVGPLLLAGMTGLSLLLPRHFAAAPVMAKEERGYRRRAVPGPQREVFSRFLPGGLLGGSGPHREDRIGVHVV